MNYLIPLLVVGMFTALFVYVIISMNKIDRCYRHGCSLARQKCKDPNYQCDAK